MEEIQDNTLNQRPAYLEYCFLALLFACSHKNEINASSADRMDMAPVRGVIQQLITGLPDDNQEKLSALLRGRGRRGRRAQGSTKEVVVVITVI